MYPHEPRSRITHQGSAMTRARKAAQKALLVLGGVVMLASAFVISLVFFVILAAVVLVGGGYLWWHTRELRKQWRERMRDQERSMPRASGEVIEGEFVSRD